MEVEVPADAAPAGPSGRIGFWARWGQRKAAQAAADYASTLASASNDDFSDLDALEFLQTDMTDKEGRPVIAVISKNYKAKVLQPERVYRYLIDACDELVDEPYCLLWVQTGSSYWHNCPGISWLWRTYERLPEKYRTNLHRMYVLHCDLSLWLGLAAVGPLMSQALWRKVVWVSRVEFLADHFQKRSLKQLPAFVLEHDAILEEHPLMDYGIVAAKEAHAVPGMPPPPQ